MGKVSVLISENEIAAKVAELGAKISKDYDGRELVVIGILKGSFVFLSDLVRQVTVPHVIDFMRLSSYGDSTEHSGVVQILLDISKPIEGRHVLVVEDIVDTGLTMKYLLENLRTRRPSSVKVCSLLQKPARTKVEVPIDYLGFTIPDKFVVGYGLDWEEKYRNLPFVGYMEN
ncbi:MAG: hypoxanthine phosphoribosyltransferase [Deltaproteobacteria bacterium]|nr:hypoxanthine phosphoribosyltransferase [Deltaproteobacteria bacterium]